MQAGSDVVPCRTARTVKGDRRSHEPVDFPVSPIDGSAGSVGKVVEVIQHAERLMNLGYSREKVAACAILGRVSARRLSRLFYPQVVKVASIHFVKSTLTTPGRQGCAHKPVRGLSFVAENGLSEGVAISSASIDHSCGRTGLVHPPGPSTEATTFDAQGLP